MVQYVVFEQLLVSGTWLFLRNTNAEFPPQCFAFLCCEIAPWLSLRTRITGLVMGLFLALGGALADISCDVTAGWEA